MRTPITRVPMRRVAAVRRASWLRRRARLARARFARQPWPLMLLEFATVVGLLALLYLSQVAALTTTRQTLLQEQTRQTTLRRQDAELHAQLGRLHSPAYVERRARALGMVPANPASVVWITLHDASH